MNLGPGIYTDLSNADYHGHKESWSKSGIEVAFKQTLRHCRWSRDNHKESTADMRIGSAFHCLTLEPHLFELEFVINDSTPMDAELLQLVQENDPEKLAVYPGKVRNGKAWLEFEAANKDKTILIQPQFDRAKQYLEQYSGKILITSDQHKKAIALRDETMRNPEAREIIEHPNRVIESSFFWACPDTGLLLRCRPDIYIKGEYRGLQNPAYDLKSARDATPGRFYYHARDLGYFRQAAHYLDGMAANGVISDAFGFIATDKIEPHSCVVFHQVHQMELETARAQMLEAKQEIAIAEFSGEWPGHPDSFDVLGNGGAFDFEIEYELEEEDADFRAAA